MPKLGINSNIYSIYQQNRSQSGGAVSIITPDVTISSMTSLARAGRSA
jgi:hypothetical protein